MSSLTLKAVTDIQHYSIDPLHSNSSQHSSDCSYFMSSTQKSTCNVLDLLSIHLLFKTQTSILDKRHRFLQYFSLFNICLHSVAQMIPIIPVQLHFERLLNIFTIIFSHFSFSLHLNTRQHFRSYQHSSDQCCLIDPAHPNYLECLG